MPEDIPDVAAARDPGELRQEIGELAAKPVDE